jgi:lipopolysaccharide transport system permease protein
MWLSVIRSRYLVCQLFKRDFLFAYKRSFLSVGWFFISPLLGILSWVFMNATNILEPGDVGMPYPAYILISTSIWGLFMGFYQSASETLYSGLPFILDIKCPHEILLVKQTAQHLAGFLLGFIITLIVLLLFRIRIGWGIVFFPFTVAPLFFLGAGLGLVAAIFRVVMPDLKRWLDFSMQLLMFITPVVYSESIKNPLLTKVITYNPLTYLVAGARDLVVRGNIEHVWGFVAASIFSFVVFLFASRAMYLSEDKIIERMF